MATGDAMRVTLVGHIDYEPINMTFGIVEGAGSGTDPNPLVNLAADVVANVLPGCLAGFSDRIQLTEVVVADVQPGTAGAVHAYSTIDGDSMSNAAPPHCCCVVSWRTALRGPENRGRMYVSGLPLEMAANGYWSADAQNIVSAFASKIFDPYGADGTNYQLNVLSYVPGSTPRALRAAIPITGFSVGNLVKVQRRRGVGVRIHRRSTAP